MYVGKIGKYPIGLIRTEKGMASLLNLQKGIPYFPNAKYLVAVGVCYVNSREEVRFGGVIISNEIQATGPAQNTKEGFVPRGGSKHMHPDIRHIFCDDRDFVPKFQVTKSGRNAKYYAKKILSAPWVNDDPPPLPCPHIQSLEFRFLSVSDSHFSAFQSDAISHHHWSFFSRSARN